MIIEEPGIEFVPMEHSQSFSEVLANESIDIDENDSVDSFKSLTQEYPMDVNCSKTELSIQIEKKDLRFGQPTKKNRITKSKRAGLIFPVKRIHNQMKSLMPGKKILTDSSIKLAAVLEYLVAELLDVSGIQTFETKMSVIKPRHIFLATQNDNDFKKVFKRVSISESGVVGSFRK
jgi:histone H2A